MRGRPSIALSNAERATLARWSAYVIGVLTVLIVAVPVLPVFKGHADDGGSARLVQSAPHAICADLDRLASSVIAERAQNRPIDVAEIGDMIASMRRGRRTCEIGWPQLACGEYQAILDRGRTGASDSFDRSGGCPETTAANTSAQHRH
jgi:hypothetical protein